MYGSKAFFISLMTPRSASGAWHDSHDWHKVPSVIAAVIVACFGCARTSHGQIEVDAYITNLTSNNVTVINASTGAVVKTIPLNLGIGPVGVGVTPDGRFAYITDGGGANPGSNTVSVIDVATNTLVPPLLPVGTSPAGIAVTPDANFAYVANRDSGTVSVFNTLTNATATIPGVGSILQGVAIAPDGKTVYVAGGPAAGTVSVINTVVNTVGTPIPVGSEPIGIAITPDGKFAYVANNGSNTISVISTATNSVVNTIDLALAVPGGQPSDVAISPDGGFVYVTSISTDSVLVIATASNTVVGTILTGSQPAGVSVTPNGADLFVTNFLSNTVSEISTSTDLVSTPFTLEQIRGRSVTSSDRTLLSPQSCR